MLGMSLLLISLCQKLLKNNSWQGFFIWNYTRFYLWRLLVRYNFTLFTLVALRLINALATYCWRTSTLALFLRSHLLCLGDFPNGSSPLPVTRYPLPGGAI